MMDWRESRVFAFPEQDDVRTEEKNEANEPNEKQQKHAGKHNAKTL